MITRGLPLRPPYYTAGASNWLIIIYRVLAACREHFEGAPRSVAYGFSRPDDVLAADMAIFSKIILLRRADKHARHSFE